MSVGSKDEPRLDPDVYSRIIELTNKIMEYDRMYHKRRQYLIDKGTTDYHIDNDIVLRNLSGATRVMCDLVTGLRAGWQTYREAYLG